MGYRLLRLCYVQGKCSSTHVQEKSTSYTQVYGAHSAAFYVHANALESSLKSLAHHFLAVNNSPMKIQVGGPGYELVHAASGVVSYLLSLTPENSLEASYAAITQHEQSLLKPLLSFLTDKQQYDRGVRLVGTSNVDLSRVPTVSFVVTGPRAMKSKDIVSEFDKEKNVRFRFSLSNARFPDLPVWRRSVSALAIFTPTVSSPMRHPSWIPMMVSYASLSSTTIR